MKVRRRGPVGWSLIGILIGPPVLMSGYLTLSRWPLRWFTGSSDWVALMVSVVEGVACIVHLPVPAAARVALALLYTLAVGYGLFVYSLYFVGIMFDDWL